MDPKLRQIKQKNKLRVAHFKKYNIHPLLPSKYANYVIRSKRGCPEETMEREHLMMMVEVPEKAFGFTFYVYPNGHCDLLAHKDEKYHMKNGFPTKELKHYLEHIEEREFKVYLTKEEKQGLLE